MTGREEEEYGPEDFAPVPHPDDRLWRHPAEMAAMRAAHARAETAKVPVVRIADRRAGRRTHFGLLAAATVVAVGATALTIGFLSSSGSSSRVIAADQASERVTDTELAVAASDNTPASLADDLHVELAMSLPRVQAATDAGMRDGSGLFVTSTGHIVTSAGLVADAKYVIVWTDDDRRWEATVVAADPVSDVAVLRIEIDTWPAVTLGVNRAVRSGQYAITIDHGANSMRIGELAQVSDGVDDPSARLVVQDAAALPGSAILDDAGFVIGMATFERPGHATPARMIERVALELILAGEASHSWLHADADASNPAPPAMSMREIEAMLAVDGLF